MENFLSKLIGKEVDILCTGAASLRGEVIKVEGGVLYLRDSNDQNCFVAIDKIVVVWEAREDTHKAGFMPAGSKE